MITILYVLENCSLYVLMNRLSIRMMLISKKILENHENQENREKSRKIEKNHEKNPKTQNHENHAVWEP